MTREERMILYTDAARLIYGPRWQSEAARYHGVAVRTVQRWVALEQEIPGGVFVEMVDLLHQRWAEIQTLTHVIAEAMAAEPERYESIRQPDG